MLELEEMGSRWIPNDDDIFLVTKHWLADKQVARAIMVVPASVASEIRRGFHSPGGVANRRLISEQVRKNIQRQLPPCHKSGEVSAEALKYLQQWSTATLPRIRRPSEYAILRYRYSSEFMDTHVEGTWSIPNRIKHFDLKLANNELGSDSSGSESDADGAAVDLPEGFES